MAHPLYWTAEDLGNDLAIIVDILRGGPPQRFFDYFGAEKPEEALLPISYWSKERILFYVNNSDALRPAYPTLKRMKLADLQACALRRVLVAPTGRCWTEEDMKAHEWRHTTFWSLDTDWIKRVAEAST